MNLTVVAPILVSLAYFMALARALLYRPRYRRLQDVILFVRHLDMSHFEALVDSSEEWGIRNALPEQDFQELQKERIQLAFEYLRRMAHNSGVIRTWLIEVCRRFEKRPGAQLND